MTAPFRGSDTALTRRVLGGRRYTQLSRDLFVLTGSEVTLRTRVDAARLVFPDGIPCRETSALLQKLPVDDDAKVHLARGVTAARSRRTDVKVHRLAIADDETMEVDGLVIADGPRTFTDLAAGRSLEGLVAVGDVLLRRWGDAALAEAVRRARGRPGSALLSKALPLLDAGSDSPAETRARLRLHAAGFTGLRHGVVVRDAGGGWLGEPDLADEVARVSFQYEGAVHFLKGEQQRRRDVDRDEVVRCEAWEVVVATSRDDARPDRLIERMTQAYLRAARNWGPHVLPPHLRQPFSG